MEDAAESLHPWLVTELSAPTLLKDDLWVVTGRSRLAPEVSVRWTGRLDDPIFDSSFITCVCVDVSTIVARAEVLAYPTSTLRDWRARRPSVTFVGQHRWILRFAPTAEEPARVLEFRGLRLVDDWVSASEQSA